MNCQYCGEEFALKRNWIAKKCPCDEEERFISFEEWYYSLFKVAFPTGVEPVFSAPFTIKEVEALLGYGNPNLTLLL